MGRVIALDLRQSKRHVSWWKSPSLRDLLPINRDQFSFVSYY